MPLNDWANKFHGEGPLPNTHLFVGTDCWRSQCVRKVDPSLVWNFPTPSFKLRYMGP